MAGSYSHLKRAVQPGTGKINRNSYGGVDTSLIEHMGDAIEVMVGMYWMIEILSSGDRSKIRAAEEQAIEIEAGRRPAPNVETNDGT